MGFETRHQLSRWLGKHGLPTFRTLTDWARLIAALRRWQEDGSPLVRQAWDSGLEPSVCYRSIRRAAGMGWHGVRTAGLTVWHYRWDMSIRSRARCMRPVKQERCQ